MDKQLKITKVVNIGELSIGGNNPILIQSMTDVSPSDLDSSIEQCIRIFDSGAGLVRIATPAIRDAKLLKEIRLGLNVRGYTGPLAADVHFSANIAEMAAAYVEKVRINPGNYIDKKDYLIDTDEAWQQEISKIRNRLDSLVKICKRYKRAIRIGVNHGSLSDRILRRYGDTPKGMVESAMEFLRILKAFDFHDIVLSLKSSNPLVMVKANRLLKETMLEENMNYPFHLGVTEAGEGIEGRIRSAMGIGLLLWEGIGDTIRVSLTEAPENEVPVAQFLLKYFQQVHNNREINSFLSPPEAVDFGDYSQIRKKMQTLSGHYFPFVVKQVRVDDETSFFRIEDQPNLFRSYSLAQLYNQTVSIQVDATQAYFLRCTLEEDVETLIEFLKGEKQAALMLEIGNNVGKIQQLKAFVERIRKSGITCPIVVRGDYLITKEEEYALTLSLDLAPFLIAEHPLIQGFSLTNPHFTETYTAQLIMEILQVSRQRISRTEFISCPGCGRTLFNLQEKTRQVKETLGNIKGLKIAVMGCMVNGPGEMADADVGFVGAGGGRVSLYAGKELVKKNIPEGEAIDEMLGLIKKMGYL